MFPLKTFHALSTLIFLLLVAVGTPTLAQTTTASSAASKGQFAFVHNMQPSSGGAFTLLVDYAELLSGDAASRAEGEEGVSATKDGRILENRTQTLRKLTVPAWAQVYLLQAGQPTLVKPAVLYSLLQGEKSPFGTFYGFPFRCEGENARCLPVRIIQRGGRVLRIEQEYLR